MHVFLECAPPKKLAVAQVADLQVEALQETLQTLASSDDAIMQLAEQKASLQLQLKDAQVHCSLTVAMCAVVSAASELQKNVCLGKERKVETATPFWEFRIFQGATTEMRNFPLSFQAEATTAEATLAQQAAYVRELEQVCQSLRHQLDAAMTQHVAAQSAVEGAADRLQLLAEEKQTLEQRLQQAQQACAAAEASAGQVAAEQTAELAQQQAHSAAIVAQLERQLASLAAEKDRLAGEVQLFVGQKAELQELTQVGVWWRR